RVDTALRRRGAAEPLPDAERSRGRARRDLRAGPGIARAERAAARGARHGRGARARAGGRRLAAAAAARSRRRVVDPARAGRADGLVNIVEDVKARGLDAVREWSLRLDGAEPARAVSEPEGLPRDALRTLAGRVRRWHEAQRPRDVTLEVEP